jgi:uncharacterized protein (DUF362 family)
MEGNGPIQGTRKHAGVVVAGRGLVSVDATCCQIMGIDPGQIRYLQLASAGRTPEWKVPQIGEPVESVRTAFQVIPQLRQVLQVVEGKS